MSQTWECAFDVGDPSIERFKVNKTMLGFFLDLLIIASVYNQNSCLDSGIVELQHFQFLSLFLA